MSDFNQVPESIPWWLFHEDGVTSWRAQTARGESGTEQGDDNIGCDVATRMLYLAYNQDALTEALDRVWEHHYADDFTGLDGHLALMNLSPEERQAFQLELNSSLECLYNRVDELNRELRFKVKEGDKLEQTLLNLRREEASYSRVMLVARRRAKRASKVRCIQ
jgi:hypothetical protein